MKHFQNRQQFNLLGMESWHGSLSERKVELLEKGWPGIFRQYFTPNLPVEKIATKYSDRMGRPTKDLITGMGAIVLQQIFDLTDERTQKQLAFNQEWHYALDTFEQNEQLVSLKTLWTVRQHINEESLEQEIFESITDELADAFNVDTRFQRLDSVHIHSNMACLGRVRLMARTITKLLKNLKRQDPDLYKKLIPDEFLTRYLNEKSDAYFGSVKPSGSKRRLIDIANDLYWLLETVSDYKEITGLYSYNLLKRVFDEQCRVKKGAVIVIPARKVASDSLQNPSDPDAGYDGHKGQGYQVQVMETYTPEEPAEDESEAEDKQPSLNLITYAKVEPAHVHDSAALKPALENVEERQLKPEELEADTSYGGDDNVESSKKLGVTLIAPVPGRSSNKNYDGFEFNKETQEVEKCPEGHSPNRIKKNSRKGSLTASFDEAVCTACALFKDGKCGVVKGKRGYRLQYIRKEIRIYRRRLYEETKEFKDKYRWRSGIEATNSRYIHMTGARRLKYRGIEKVSWAGITKVLGINLFRTAKYVRETSKLLDNNLHFGLKWLVNYTKQSLIGINLIIKRYFDQNFQIAGYSIGFAEF